MDGQKGQPSFGADPADRDQQPEQVQFISGQKAVEGNLVLPQISIGIDPDRPVPFHHGQAGSRFPGHPDVVADTAHIQHRVPVSYLFYRSLYISKHTVFSSPVGLYRPRRPEKESGSRQLYIYHNIIY